MANIIVETTKPSSQLQIAPVEYSGTFLVKLKGNNCWSLAGGSKRGRLEIMAEILLYCDQRKTKTSIMYKTNLNYVQLKKHLRYLTSHGLLGREMKKYVTTEKEYRFLAIFAQLNDLLKSANM
jgi:predicted transcriptional regulator